MKNTGLTTNAPNQQPGLGSKTQLKPRISVTGDKLQNQNFKALTARILNLDNEMDYINRHDLIETNFTNFLLFHQNKLQSENESRMYHLKSLTATVEKFNHENTEMKKKIFELEKQFESLNISFQQCNERKQKYHSEIIKLRRENTNELNNRVNLMNKQDKNIKQLKKELFLIINLLKLRVVNLDSIEDEKFIKGYLIDIEKNTIKYIEINKSEEALYNCIKYWSAMKDLLTTKSNLVPVITK